MVAVAGPWAAYVYVNRGNAYRFSQFPDGERKFKEHMNHAWEVNIVQEDNEYFRYVKIRGNNNIHNVINKDWDTSFSEPVDFKPTSFDELEPSLQNPNLSCIFSVDI